MSSSILTDLLLPLSLAIIMFGMGLTLTHLDFTRLWQTPKPILIGMLGQLLLLPLIAFALAVGLSLPVEVAIGLLILAACPGGTMSNLVSHLVKANLALSISLTAISSAICVFTAPLIIQFAVYYFAGQQAAEFSLLSVSLGLLLLTLIPILVGMLVRRYAREWAIRVEVWFRRFALIMMLFLIIGLVYQEWHTLQQHFMSLFGVCILLNGLAITVGWGLAKANGLTIQDGFTLAIEVGLQNSTMAMLISISLLQMPSYAISAGIYSIAMYVGVLGLITFNKVMNKSQAVVN
ncbi:bile acid:sodium symporter family protein [Shewanella maritima]|uniref:bile acid:sodium symporter family protein n=1 Tax=Shewanella maritima TaxID=2520507 RepID=UPI003736B6B8